MILHFNANINQRWKQKVLSVLCHKKFNSKKSSLIRHMTVHIISNYIQYPHTECQKTFSTKHNLKVHFKQKHSGEMLPQKLKKVPISLLQKLREWAINHRITARTINDLLKMLICCGFSWLPADYRAFLNTPRTVEISAIANGQFWYIVISKNLKQIFSNLDRDLTISLKFNMDGLPLFNSLKLAFWPILAAIHGIKNNFSFTKK